MNASDAGVAVVICTRHRPEQLAEVLDSLVHAEELRQVVVSDDSTRPDALLANEGHARAFASRCPAQVRVVWAKGPSRGLAANRNAALRLVDQPWVAFLDDDARLSADFLAPALAAAAPDVIVTGYEDQPGHRVHPHEPDFLGFQRVPVPRWRGPRAIVINATLFPAGLLRRLAFDEFYTFGCEEIDVAARALAAGAKIVKIEAGNLHLHTPTGRDGNDDAAVRSRVYFCARRFRYYEPSPLRLLAYYLLGPLHAVLRTPGLARAERWRLLRTCLAALRASSRTTAGASR